ncbi:MAG: hypothetical protein JO318_01505 [Chloroflexi bacterium]|nr:hypothetical protein [Chloroflexota bacterium]MBV9131341.1 hypothetical protein [Chloroflexota bacterium]
MVLDAKALTWAAKNEIDTPKLKKAKVPIYGKWYFPEIPPNVALTNLETGEQVVFPERMIAGEVIYVPSSELVRAGLAPADFAVIDLPSPPGAVEAATRAIRAVSPEPLIAMVRPPGLALDEDLAPIELDGDLVAEPPADLSGIHMPSPSIAPFVLGIGFCLVFLGLITNVIIFATGLLWMLAGAIVWIRIGVLEYRASHARAVATEVEPTP